jgi:hypothetical protein
MGRDFFEKFFKEPEKEKKMSEEDIESRMAWYYIRKDPIDLMIEGRVVDAGGNYQLITDVGLPTILRIYCTLGKLFDADYVKNLFENLPVRRRAIRIDQELVSIKEVMCNFTGKYE